MKLRLFFIMVLGLALPGSILSQTLTVSENQRYLCKNGEPFLWIGDTAWDLFRQLDRGETDQYLQDRAEKGFTVIQAVVLFGRGGVDKPNAYGNRPFIDNDLRKPNPEYFQHVDHAMQRSRELGLVMGLLPTWGNYWGAGDPENRLLNPENACEYGKFLGERYIDEPLVWILGGDENIKNEYERETIRELARGLQEGDGGAHLITFHPRGPGLSSEFAHDEDWLDFNMVQSSHGGHGHDNGLYAEHDYGLTPVKPTLDGEPRYENIPVGFYFQGMNAQDKFDAFDCRQAAYWSLLAGACGHTYGHNSVFQFYQGGTPGAFDAQIPWQQALDHPGAFQMGLVRKLFESRPYYLLQPAQYVILNGPTSGPEKIRAALAGDRSFVLIYSPYGVPFTLDSRIVEAAETREIWFDPRHGFSYDIHTTHTMGFQTYTPPTRGRGNDWILIIEDKDKNFPFPVIQQW